VIPAGLMRAPNPENSIAVVRVRARFVETDLMGVVHHASYASYMEVARIEWLRRRGVTYAAWAQKGLHLAVVELKIKYRAPARFDDELDVETALAEVGAASVRFDYRIVRSSDGVVCTEASTRLACVDNRGALLRITDEMLAALTRDDGSV
jgi:acyl-CoA thioester hydrolase